MDENEVILKLCSHLERAGYRILERRRTTKRGTDVVAKETKSGRLLRVEAKGGTSSRVGSARYGKPYTQSQVFDRVAKGVFTTLQLRFQSQNGKVCDVALAVPDEKWFRFYLEPLGSLLASVGIDIFLVGPEGHVDHLADQR